MATLTVQPTAAMSRKQFWTLISGGSVTLMFWALDALAGIKADPVVVGTAVGMAGAIVGYTVRDRIIGSIQ